MEITPNGSSGAKIKSKRLTIVYDPEKKIDADVAIFTKTPNAAVYHEYLLVIEGPGEYEKNGVYIRGRKMGEGVSYEIMDGSSKVTIGTNEILEKLKDEEDIDTLVIKALGNMSVDSLAPFSANAVLVFGEGAATLGEKNKVSRASLKNREEFAGNVTVLSA